LNYPYVHQTKDQALNYPYVHQTKDQALNYPYVHQTKDQALNYPYFQYENHYTIFRIKQVFLNVYRVLHTLSQI